MTVQENKLAWSDYVREIAKAGYATIDSISWDDNGWEWVRAGHNDSCMFFVGHNCDYTTFAIKVFSRGIDAQGIPGISIDKRNYSGSLHETIDGAYLGHY